MTLVVCVRPKGFVFVAFPEPAHTSISMFQKLHMSRNCISSLLLEQVDRHCLIMPAFLDDQSWEYVPNEGSGRSLVPVVVDLALDASRSTHKCARSGLGLGYLDV